MNFFFFQEPAKSGKSGKSGKDGQENQEHEVKTTRICSLSRQICDDFSEVLLDCYNFEVTGGVSGTTDLVFDIKSFKTQKKMLLKKLFLCRVTLEI